MDRDDFIFNALKQSGRSQVNGYIFGLRDITVLWDSFEPSKSAQRRTGGEFHNTARGISNGHQTEMRRIDGWREKYSFKNMNSCRFLLKTGLRRKVKRMCPNSF